MKRYNKNISASGDSFLNHPNFPYSYYYLVSNGKLGRKLFEKTFQKGNNNSTQAQVFQHDHVTETLGTFQESARKVEINYLE